MGQFGSTLSPGHNSHSAHLPDHDMEHIMSKTGPTSPQWTRASGPMKPCPQPDDDGLCGSEPGRGDELKHPQKPRAEAMDDGGSDNNHYYADEYVLTKDPNDYKRGGLHPVALGERFGPSGHYRVFNKLGFGGWGTVWLCRDTLGGTWRALKINSAYDNKKPVRNAYRELMIRQHLDLTFGGDLADHHIGIPSEYFWISGPNGHHLCAVMPVLGPTLTSVHGYYGIDPNVPKDICFQLAQSLKFLHSHGICHGDFRPANILFQLADDIDEWSEEDMDKVLGPPVVTDVHVEGTHRRGLGVPAYLVSPRALASIECHKKNLPLLPNTTSNLTQIHSCLSSPFRPDRTSHLVFTCFRVPPELDLFFSTTIAGHRERTQTQLPPHKKPSRNPETPSLGHSQCLPPTPSPPRAPSPTAILPRRRNARP